MGYKKFSRQLLSWIVKVIVYGILGVPAVLYNVYLRCRQSGEVQTGTVKVAGSEEFDVNNVDFVLHRSTMEIDRMTYGTLEEVANFFSGKQKVDLVTDYILRHVLLHSYFSHGLQTENDPFSNVQWKFSFDHLGRRICLRNYTWQVTEIWILKSGRLNIKDSSGKIHSAKSTTWPLAKAHAQVQLTVLAPGLVQNVDTLVLSTVVAQEARENLPPDSILGLLLKPHTKFAEAARARAMSDVTGQMLKNMGEKVLLPKIDDLDRVAITTLLREKRQDYYTQNRSLVPILSDDIPYQSFLKGYYNIFRKFVFDLAPLLEKDYNILRVRIGKHLPGIASHDMVDVLSTVLWNCSVVQSCDAESYLNRWANQYGCMKIRFPLVTPKTVDNKIKISTISDGKDLSASSDSTTAKCTNQPDVVITMPSETYSALDGTRFFCQTDVCRTKCFLKTFVRNTPPAWIDLKLSSIKYGFSDQHAIKAARDFMTEMNDLSSYHKQRGEAIVPWDRFLQCVCV